MATLTTFTANTLIKSAEVNGNFTGLSDGTMDTDHNSLQIFRDEGTFDYVGSGGVWTGDSLAVNRNASMTALVATIDGWRNTIAAVTARTFTASKDTYIDILRSSTTLSLVYTEVANNAASPALASNSLRLGIIVTGATTIAAAGSINQGQEDRILPISSSIPYAVTDSLGNLICPRDPQRRVLGYRQITSDFTTASTSAVQVTGLTCPVIVPTGRKIRVSVMAAGFFNGTAANGALLGAWDGTVGSGTKIANANGILNTSSASPGVATAVVTPTSSSKTYNASAHSVSAGTTTVQAATTGPAYILVELI